MCEISKQKDSYIFIYVKNSFKSKRGLQKACKNYYSVILFTNIS